jgi:hypothetical protein
MATSSQVGQVGIFTDPGHVIAFADGEARQEFSLCFRARPVGGEIKVSSKSFAVWWVPRADWTLLTSRGPRVDASKRGSVTPRSL